MKNVRYKKDLKDNKLVNKWIYKRTNNVAFEIEN